MSQHQEIANRFAPIVFLSASEKYLPCSVDHYLTNSALMNRSGVVIPRGDVKATDLPTQPEASDWSLDCAQEAWRGADANTLADIPFYARVIEGEQTYEIAYIFFYAYNGAFNVFNISKLEAGAHQADLEHVSVFVSKSTMEVEKVYYSAHGANEGEWVMRPDLVMEDGRVVVYSARGSHATYPSSGTIWRCVGAINDHTDKGLAWNPKKTILVDNDTPWNQFSGCMGFPDAVSAPMRKSWWWKEDGISTNFFSRLCCLCLPKPLP